MSNLFEYVEEWGQHSLEELPFCEVDNLVLSTLAYVPMGGAAPAEGEERRSLREVAARYFEMPVHAELRDKKDAELLRKAAESPRFGGMELSLWVSRLDREVQEQFGAVTFHTGDGAAFVAYQGTDNSLVGWKENFNMGFQFPVPAQAEAARYLEAAARAWPGVPLRIGGHSKGGNLAVYAAATCSPEVRERILAVYNNDGPGFVGTLLESPGYLAIQDRVHTYVPQSAVVGMLLNHAEDYVIIRSSQRLILQHDPYSWETEEGRFVHLQKLDSGSVLLDHTLRSWIYGMEPAQREGFVDALYEILSASEAETLPQLAADWIWRLPRVIRKLHNLDAASRRVVKRTLLQLFRSARDTIPEVWLSGLV